MLIRSLVIVTISVALFAAEAFPTGVRYVSREKLSLLAEQLQDPDPARRAEAILELRRNEFLLHEAGRIHLGKVLELARDENPAVREQLLGLFGDFNHQLDYHPSLLKEVVPPMIEALLVLMASSTSEGERSDIWEAAEVLQPSANFSLAVALSSEDPTIRLAAAEIIYADDVYDGVDDPLRSWAERVLVQLFIDGDTDIAYEASWAIEDLDEMRYPGLIEALLWRIDRQSDEEVRVEYLRLLSSLGGLDSRTVPHLTEALRLVDRHEAGRVIAALGRVGPDALPAIPVLERFTEEGGEFLRPEVLRALARIRPSDETIWLLHDHLAGPDHVKAAAADGLALLGAIASPAVERLRYVSTVRNEATAAAAASALAAISGTGQEEVFRSDRDPAAMDYLLNAVRSDDLFIRRDAARRVAQAMWGQTDLGLSVDEDLVGRLSALLRDDDLHVRNAATKLLGFAERIPPETLAEMVRNSRVDHHSLQNESRLILRRALEMQSEECITLLIEEETLDPEARRELADMLAETQYGRWTASVRRRWEPGSGGKNAEPAYLNDTRLAGLFDDPDRGVRRSIAVASRGSIESLISGSRSDSVRSRRVAVWALAQHVSSKSVPAVPSERIIAALVERLDDEDAEVRRRAARSLESWRGYARSAIPRLKDALGDEDRQVRIAAGHAIRRIDDFYLDELLAALGDERLATGVLDVLGSLYGDAADAESHLRHVRDQFTEHPNRVDWVLSRIGTPVRMQVEVTLPLPTGNAIALETRPRHEWPRGYWPFSAEVVIDPEGRVDEAIVMDGFDHDTNAVFLEALRSTKFEPARSREGEPAWVRLTLWIREAR